MTRLTRQPDIHTSELDRQDLAGLARPSQLPATPGGAGSKKARKRLWVLSLPRREKNRGGGGG